MTDLITPELVYFLNTPTQAAFLKRLAQHLLTSKLWRRLGKKR